MKYVFLIICLGISVTFLGSCKKHGSNPGVLTGRWELRAEQGAQIPMEPSDFLPGNGTIWEFTDGSHWKYSDRHTTDSGQYRITRDTISPYQTKMDKLTLIHSPSQSWALFFQLSSDSLKIYSGIIAADGSITTYARMGTE